MAEQFTCIVCPLGCSLSVNVDGDDVQVNGNQCARGVDYGMQEAVDPRRVICSSVLVEGGAWPLVSVRSSAPIPKGRIMDVMSAVKRAVVQAPVVTGQVLVTDVAGTGVDIVATKEVHKK